MIKLTDILRELLEEKKADRCLRIARQKYDKPSAYRSGAIVRCRRGEIWKDLKEVENQIQSVLDKTKTHKIQYNRINQDLKKNWIPTWKIDYDNDLAQINELVARHLLYKIAEDLVGGVSEIEFKNKSKSPTNHFQMEMYLGNVILFTAPFIYVDDNHKIVPDRTKIELLNEDYDTLHILNEDESLHKWFNRQGAPGKSKGWVDCNTCREVDGKTKCKPCGRKEGEKRVKYPSCRPTPAGCKKKGKGKTWGKIK